MRNDDINLSNLLHDSAPAIAVEFMKLDQSKKRWTVEDDRLDRDNLPNLRVHLVRQDGLAVMLYANKWDERVSCSISLPNMPALFGNGSRGALREFIPYVEGRERPTIPDAGASTTRYAESPEKVARDFFRRVVAPYAEVYPTVLRTIEAHKKGWQDARDTAARIAAAHGGTIRDPQNGGERLYVYFTSDMPALEVGYMGSIRTDRALTLPEHVVDAMLNAWKEGSK